MRRFSRRNGTASGCASRFQCGVHDAVARLTNAFLAAARARKRTVLSPRDAYENRSSSSIAFCSCCSPKRAVSCPTGTRSFATATRLNRCAMSRAPSAPRTVGGAAGHRASRASRLPGRFASRPAVQRPPVLPGACAARRLAAARRSRGAPGAAALTTRPDRGGRERIAYARSRRRTARRRLRAAARLRRSRQPRPRRARPRSRRTAEGHRHRSTRRARSRNTSCGGRSRRSSSDAAPEDILRLRDPRPCDGQRSVSGRGVPLPRAGYEAALVREGGLQPRGHHRCRARGLPADRRAALPVRRRPQSDGGPARAAVAVARYLVGDRPLTFFDHQLRAGNSLVGARLKTRRDPPVRLARRRSGAVAAVRTTSDSSEAFEHAVTSRWRSRASRRIRSNRFDRRNVLLRTLIRTAGPMRVEASRRPLVLPAGSRTACRA